MNPCFSTTLLPQGLGRLLGHGIIKVTMFRVEIHYNRVFRGLRNIIGKTFISGIPISLVKFVMRIDIEENKLN